jgi:hypothetical protein
MGASNEQNIPTDGFADFESSEGMDEEQVIPGNELANDVLPDDDIIGGMDEDDIPDDIVGDPIFSEEEGNDPDKINVEVPGEVPADKAEAEAADKAKAEAEPGNKPAEPELSKKDKFDRYSRSVQRRINKEVKQREQLRAQNEELRHRLENVESHMSQNYERQEQDKFQSELNTLTNRIKNASAIKAQLLEDGDYAQLAKVDDDIMQMRIHQARLEERDQNIKYAAEQQRNGNQQGQQEYDPNTQYENQDPNQKAQEYIPEVQKQWINSNKRYAQDSNYAQYVDNVYDDLLDEGYDPESGNLYQELNKRTGTRPQQIRQPNQQASRPQAAPAPNVAQAQARSTGNAKGITESDKVKMRNWGMNPNDPNTRKEWLRNKRAG